MSGKCSPFWSIWPSIYCLILFFSKRRCFCLLDQILIAWFTIFKETIFVWRIYTFVQVDQNVIYCTEKYFLPTEYTPLTKIVLYAFQNLIYSKTIHLCVSVFKFFFLLNNYLCGNITKMVFSILENVFRFLIMFSTWRIYTSV